MENGSISERAIAASDAAREAARTDRIGAHKQDLNEAIFNALQSIPEWVQATATGGEKFKFRYATMKDILTAVRPALMAQGIRIRQGSNGAYPMDDGGTKGRLVKVYTDLVHHESCQVERTEVEIPITKLDPQAMGSALTYGRRYSLLAALGITTDESDDDGQRAMPKEIATPEIGKMFAEMRDEIAKIDAVTDLVAWKSDKKNIARYGRLTEAEQALLGQAYHKRQQDLLTEAAQ